MGIKILFSLGLSFCLLASQAQAAMSGKFMVVKGDVKINRGTSEVIKAKVSLSVFPGDTIVSGKDARAKIVMEDKNVIHISPDTTLKIEKYVNDGTNKNVELNLKEGKIRNNVENVYEGNNKYLIKTPTAVAGVRGTQFIMSFNPRTSITELITIQGKIELTNLASGTTGAQNTVMVSRGEKSEVSADKPPAPPQPIPKDQMRTIEQDATTSGGQGGTKSAPAAEAGQAPPPRSERRIEDRQDQSPDTFKKVPETAVTNQPAPPGTATGFKPPPPPPPLVNDVIRNQNDKSKVIIDAK